MIREDNNIRADAHMWRARIDDGLDAVERQNFDQWLHSDPRHFDAYTKAEAFWGRTGQAELARAIGETFVIGPMQASPAAPDQAIREGQPVRQESALLAGLKRWFAQSTPHLAGSAAAIAACVAALLFFTGPGFFTADGPAEAQTFATTQGNTKIITLPDRSRIVLGAASEIALTQSDNARTVELVKGNAYFDVASDASRPFTVATDLAKVTVTGTRFDVRLREETVDIAVGEGSVNVARPDANGTDPDMVQLVAGQGVRATRDKGFGAISEVFPAEFAAWRNGRLIYVRAPLSDVIDDINRYTDTPVRLGPGVGALELSGTFDTANIEGLLQSIDEGSPVAIIERDGERVIVRD
ncbi:MAG: FecR domain-containing protein [Pseudomonadota bacterium]